MSNTTVVLADPDSYDDPGRGWNPSPGLRSRDRPDAESRIRAIALYVLDLLYFMAPAYLANMAPPFVRY